jgi:hypothetical protein
MYREFLITLSIFCLIVCPTHPTLARAQATIPGAWRVELIDRAPGDENDPGILRYPSLVIDNSGVPQVMYSKGLEQETSNPLVYARKDGPAWVTQTIETSGEKPSLALSNQQQPRAAFLDFAAASESLVFRNLDIAGGFRQVITDGIGAIQATTDLALGSNDTPVVVFTQKAEGNNFNVWLATVQTTTLNVESAPVAEEVGSIASLALGPAHQVHLSYQDAASRTVKYAMRALTDTAWVSETVSVSDTLNIAIPSSIAVDASATPHIVYIRFQPPTGLIYAKRTASGWVTETIAANANLDFSFVLDKDGNPHIAYIEPFTRRLIYALRSNNTWMTATASSDATAYLSLALDFSGQPSIAYTEFDTGNLKLARLYRGLVYLPLAHKP